VYSVEKQYFQKEEKMSQLPLWQRGGGSRGVDWRHSIMFVIKI